MSRLIVTLSNGGIAYHDINDNRKESQAKKLESEAQEEETRSAMIERVQAGKMHLQNNLFHL